MLAQAEAWAQELDDLFRNAAPHGETGGFEESITSAAVTTPWGVQVDVSTNEGAFGAVAARRNRRLRTGG